MTSLKIIGIMAATKTGVISHNSIIPWNYPTETMHFNAVTKGHIIIMGRKTYDTMPKNFLLDKKIIIFSRRAQVDNDSIYFVKSLNECFATIQKLGNLKKIFMIGGAEIAHLFLSLNLISSFILTTINHSYQGDTYLDIEYFKKWNKKILTLHPAYTIYHLINPAQPY